MTTVLITKLNDEKASANACRVQSVLRELSIDILPSTALEQADWITVVGGDGTIMHVAKQAAAYDKPVLGINSGRIGFLAGLEPEEAELLARLKTGDYKIENRMLLEISYQQSGKPVIQYALNEAAIARGGAARMMDIHVREGVHQEGISYRTDGLLAATPTS